MADKIIKITLDQLNDIVSDAVTAAIKKLDNIEIIEEQYVDFRNENNIKNIFENRYLSLNYTDFEVEKIKKYNPIEFLEYINNRLDYSLWDKGELISILFDMDSSKMKRSECELFFEIISKLDANMYDEKLAYVELKYIDLFGMRGLPNGVKKYFYYYPDRLIKLLFFNDDNIAYDKLKFNIMHYYSLPSDFYIELNLYNNFKKSFISNATNDVELANYIMRTFGKIIGRTIDFRYDFPGADFVKREIETIHNEEFNIGYYLGVNGVCRLRTVDDGTNMRRDYERNKELLIKNKNNLECCKIIEFFCENSKIESEMDRKMYLEDKGLL